MTEEAFFQEANTFARKRHWASFLSKSRLINSLTAVILGIWLIVLLASVLPADMATNAGKRDLTELVLEVGEKLCAFVAVTAKTYTWRLATFGLVAAFSIVKKGLEVHVDPAPERVAGPNWAFAGALVAKAFEHLAYAVRLTPASRAWDFLETQPTRESLHLSVEQWARRSLWAANYYREILLNEQLLRTAVGPRYGPGTHT